jgi:hypothetical protein
MDSAFQSERNCRNRGLEGFEAEGCDITSLVFHLRGQYEFDLTVHGRFVPPTSHKIDTIPPLELPEPAIGSSSTIGLDEGSILGGHGGLRAAFSSGVGNTVLEDESSMAAPGRANGLNADLEPVPNMKIHSNSGFNIDFSAQVEKVPLQMVPEQQTENYQTAVHRPFLNDFDEKNPNEIFSVNKPGQNVDFLEGFEANPDFPFPTFSQDTAFSSNNFNYLYDAEGSPTVPPASPEIGFFSNEFNFSNSALRSSQERSFSFASSSSSSNLTTATSSSTSATPPSIDSSPDGHFCRLCHSTFKRPSDLKRHEGVHFPEQRKYHCKQSGCERKGQKGFYRRDKLRTHERQVHGLDN